MSWLRRNRNWVIALTVVAACGGGTAIFLQGRDHAAAKSSDITAKVAKGSIRSSVTGTAQLQPKETMVLQAPAEAVVQQMNLTRNMEVKKDDVLVVLQSASLTSSMQKAMATLATLEADLRDEEEQMNALTTMAPISGILTLSNGIDVGTELNRKARIATIADNKRLTVTLPFLLEDAARLQAGDAVELTVAGFLMTKTGSITKVGTDPKPDLKGNRLLDVEIQVENDATLDANLRVTGEVQTAAGPVKSQKDGALAYSRVVNLLAGAAGTMEELHVKSGDYVEQGTVLCRVVNPNIQYDYNTKKSNYDQQLVLVQNLQEQLDALTIKAPFDGVFSTDFVDKKNNVLASLAPGAKVTGSTQFGGVASTDTMLLDIQVDELDLPSVKVGQKAEVKVDSLKNRVFAGEVTQVSTVGTTTNGVTYYDAIVSLSQTKGLKYGMTATGEILLQDKQDVLTIPLEALQSRGGKYYVSLLKNDGSKEDQHEIKIGIRNKTSVEVTSGLEEGQTIVIPTQTKTQTMSQDDINRLRQQFQQGAGTGGQGGMQNIDPATLQQMREQLQNAGGSTRGGNGTGAGTTGTSGAGTGGGAARSGGTGGGQ